MLKYTVESLIESGLYLEFGILEPDSIRVRTLFESGLHLKILKFSNKEIIKYLGILLHTIKYLGILLHTKLYCICISTPMIVYTRVVYFFTLMHPAYWTIFELGLYSSRDSIKRACLWIRTLFELGLYSSQASINDSTVYLYVPCTCTIGPNIAKSKQ